MGGLGKYVTCHISEFIFFFTGRATAGIKITQQTILRLVASQGQHDLRISVKFGKIPSAMPNFMLGGGYLGVNGQII